MTTTVDIHDGSVSQDPDSVGLDASFSKRGTALSNKLTSILSSSYADTETRDALRLFDLRYGDKWAKTEFDVKYEAQREVTEANARIVDDFSKVAKVGCFHSYKRQRLT